MVPSPLSSIIHCFDNYISKTHTNRAHIFYIAVYTMQNIVHFPNISVFTMKNRPKYPQTRAALFCAQAAEIVHGAFAPLVYNRRF